MLGGYEPDPVQPDVPALPASFDIAELPLDLGGLSASPALGEAMAEWIVDGTPPLDLSEISTARPDRLNIPAGVPWIVSGKKAPILP